MRVANRYVCGEEIGRGGGGVVWAATDDVTGTEVAIKLLSGFDTAQRIRVRREIQALGLLRVPGVVRLLDDGDHDGQVFIAMERVHGTPFPGAGPRSWEHLRPRVVELFEVIGQVHAAGVVHRDLKPGNVLVDSAGHVHILDFGLARGSELDSTITEAHQFVGTVRYVAPEQLLGTSVDGRADLFSAALMVAEALLGRLPFSGQTSGALAAERVAREAIPLRELDPNLPAAVAAILDSLLRRERKARPGSAAAVLRALAESTAPTSAPTGLRWLGSTDPVDRVVDHALRGERVTVGGPPRSGRTRVIEEVAHRLRRQGRRVGWACSGTRPFSSLVGVLGVEDQEAGIAGRMLERLQIWLDDGGVLLVDDVSKLDRWTAAIIDRPTGAVIQTTSGPATVELERINEADLWAVFAGPERVLHAPSTAARLLYQRVGGLAGRVVAELGAWERAGLCRWLGDRVELMPGAVERLEDAFVVDPEGGGGIDEASALEPHLAEALGYVAVAWPEAETAGLASLAGVSGWEMQLELEELAARGLVVRGPDRRWEVRDPSAIIATWSPDRAARAHRDMAARIKPTGPRRLEHLVRGGCLVEAAEEARVLSAQRRVEGRVGRAVALALLGLRMARAERAADAERALLEALALAALDLATPQGCAEAAYAIERSEVVHEWAGVAALLRATRASMAGERGAIDAVFGLRPLENPVFEARRRFLRASVAVRAGRDDAEGKVDELREIAGTTPTAAGLLATAEATIAYFREQFRDAAIAHLRAAAAAESPIWRARSLVGAATAELDDGRFDEAERLAREAITLTSLAGAHHDELRAEWVVRCVIYRSGREAAVDPELVEAARAVGVQWGIGQVALTEAAIAWRAGDHTTARAYAQEAATAWTTGGFGPGRTLAQSLGFAAGASMDPGELAAAARAIPIRGLRWQSAGLVAIGMRHRGMAGDAAALLDVAHRDAESLLPGRREVLAPEELV